METEKDVEKSDGKTNGIVRRLPIAIVVYKSEERVLAQRFFKCMRQLVGAAGALVATGDAAEHVLHLLCLPAFHQRADAFQVAVATTLKPKVLNDSVVADVDVLRLSAVLQKKP